MKKKFVFLGFLTLLLSVYLLSCQKEEALTETTITEKNEQAVNNDDEGTVGTREITPLNYSDCPSLLGLITKTNGRLVFQDEEHFEKCVACLEHQYDVHNDAYDALYPNATAEELDTYAALTGFNEWQPYINFEAGLNFASYRPKIKHESENFLSSTPASTIDLNQDPDMLSPVFRISERVFLNEGGEVKIGNKIKNIEDDYAKIFDQDCASFGWLGYLFDHNEAPGVLDNRQLWVAIGVESGFVVSKLIGRMKYYKRDASGNYRSNVRADMEIVVEGRGYTLSCDPSALYWYKDSGWKHRTQLQVTARIWTNFRRSFLKKDDPEYLNDLSIIHAYLFNGNNYFPLAL